ncbi:MAG: hypothetical protein QM723_29725 [Myxococcaceae bacterium]
MSRSLVLALLLPLAAVAQTKVAQPPNLLDAMSAQAYGMGGAYSGLGYNADSITGNPAAMSLYKRYLLQASGGYDFTNQYGFGAVGLQDSTTEWAAGLSYQFVAYGPPGERRTAHLSTAATSFALNSAIALGISIRHQAIVGYHGANSVTMAAGIVVRPFDYMTIGVSGNNLIGVWNDDVPRYFVVTLAGNLPYMITPIFDLRADFNDPKGARFSFNGGVEWIAFDAFPLRVGYDYDQISHTQHVGMGLGYFSNGTGVDIAYRHELNGTNGHLLSLTVKVQFE